MPSPGDTSTLVVGIVRPFKFWGLTSSFEPGLITNVTTIYLKENYRENLCLALNRMLISMKKCLMTLLAAGKDEEGVSNEEVEQIEGDTSRVTSPALSEPHSSNSRYRQWRTGSRKQEVE
jgi:hypothetical protein